MDETIETENSAKKKTIFPILGLVLGLLAIALAVLPEQAGSNFFVFSAVLAGAAMYISGETLGRRESWRDSGSVIALSGMVVSIIALVCQGTLMGLLVFFVTVLFVWPLGAAFAAIFLPMRSRGPFG